jgi:hypothetical protein
LLTAGNEARGDAVVQECEKEQKLVGGSLLGGGCIWPQHIWDACCPFE